MELNEKYSIEKEAHGFSLIEKTPVEVTKDGKKTGEIKEGKNKRSFGTVYQALQRFIQLSVDEATTFNELQPLLDKAMSEINKAEAEIKDRFRIEVLKCWYESNWFQEYFPR